MADSTSVVPPRPLIARVLDITDPDDCPNAYHPTVGKCGLCGFVRTKADL